MRTSIISTSIKLHIVQTQLIAAAAAGVAAEGLSPNKAKLEAQNAAQLSVALVENAIVMLMLVEDHLRLQSKISRASCKTQGAVSPLSLVSPLTNYSNLSTSVDKELSDTKGDRKSLCSDSSGLPLDVSILLLSSSRHACFDILALHIIGLGFHHVHLCTRQKSCELKWNISRKCQ